MNKQLLIREMKPSDLAQGKQIIEETGMFPSQYLDEMTIPFFEQQSPEFWFIAEDMDKHVVSLAYCAPERMTSGTWNLLLIAVNPNQQGKGIGKAMMSHAESKLTAMQARILLVETSGLPEYQLTRDFYPKCGYEKLAIIPDYYDAGDDKHVFYKRIGE